MSKHQKSILIVDDDPDIAHLYTLLLSQSFEGVRVLQTPTLAAAQQHIADCRPTLTLLDIELPDGNGLDWLAANANKLESVLVLSSLDQHEQAIAAGASDFIHKKSMGPDVFIRKVSNLLCRNGQAA